MEDFCSYHETYSPEQTSSISQEFRRLAGQHYLEHAGATLYSEKQLERVLSQLSSNLYANPHARNLSSKSTEDAVDVVRYQVLDHFGTTPQQYSVIFTSGATEALRIIGENFCYECPNGTDKGTFVYLQDNHTSVLGIRAYAESSTCLTLDDAVNILCYDGTKNGTVKGDRASEDKGNSLFAYPAQSNFSGRKYPLSWIEHVKNGCLGIEDHWYVVLDAASFVSTSQLDLSLMQPDFVTISFYKIFGYPTGLGALLVKNSSSHVLKKRYFGGGTVFMAQSMENHHVFRNVFHERFEDGTIPFLSILALKEGFNTLKRLNLSFKSITAHTFALAQYVYRNLMCLHHSNGRPTVVLYHNTSFENISDQGGIVNFNILRDNGEYVGFSEVLHFANLYNIHLRTGCFCNPGACQHFLRLTPELVKRQFDAGHVCGDQNDLVDGYPTGSVRVSFGYMSTKSDADKLLEMIESCFVSHALRKIPHEILDNVNHNANADEGILEQIILYPVKSCGGFSRNEWPITPRGLKYDRQWMIIDPLGVCITQKKCKNMCLIKPRIDLRSEELILSYPEYNEIKISFRTGNNMRNSASFCHSKVCGDMINGWDCGDEVAHWLEEVLNYPGLRLFCHLVDDETVIGRTLKDNEHLQLSLTNQAQYLVINSRSVEWLRNQITSEDFTENLQSTIQRFRPNLVVRFQEAFRENQFKRIFTSDINFETAGLCTRCQMICIDQNTAKTTKEPLQTLARTFRGKIAFGIYLNKSSKLLHEFLRVGSKVNGIAHKNCDNNKNLQ